MASPPRPQAVSTGFRITKFVIIESLEECEVKTGRILADLLQSLVDQYEPRLKVQYDVCDNVIEFKTLVRRLTDEAMCGLEAPILHLECHGSILSGLEFANGSSIDWPALASLLAELNIASSFNLLVALSACYGGQLLGEVLALNPAPCWCVVAPTDTIDPSDAITGFRTFYSRLIATGDAGIAASALAGTQLTDGHWFTQLSELWFERLVIDFIESHCTKWAVRKRAKELYRRAIADGRRTSVDTFIEQLRYEHRNVFTGRYFESFFCTERIPSSAARFASFRVRVHAKIADLRATGRYVI